MQGKDEKTTVRTCEQPVSSNVWARYPPPDQATPRGEESLEVRSKDLR